MAIIPSAVPSKTVGGMDSLVSNLLVPANDTGYFAIMTYTPSASPASHYPFWRNGARYKVASGKTCRVENMLFTCSTAGGQFQLVSSQTSWGTTNMQTAVGSITSGTYQGGADQIYPMICGTPGYTFRQMGFTYEFVADAYPGVQLVNNVAQYHIILICREI